MPKRMRERGFSFPITTLAGSSLPNFIKLRKDYGYDRKYLGRFLASIALSTIFEPFRWWEELWWHRRIKKTRLEEPPVFIIGFWRSGTTLLHELLCQSRNASFVTTFQTVFPHLILSHSWWLKPLANLMMPTSRPFDKAHMGLDYPQEEEIAMANLQPLSFYNFLYFPKCYERFYHRDLFFTDASDRQIRRWKSEYQKLIAKAVLNRKGKLFISKNPSNMARIDNLLEIYPDAKFIFIYRNPYKVVESYHGFFQEVIPAIQLQEQEKAVSRESVTRLYGDMIRQYFQTKDRIPAKNLIEIRYEDLTENTMPEIRKIYDQFKISSSEEDLSRIKHFVMNLNEHPVNHYSVPHETIELVNRYLMDLLMKWNYEVKT